MEFRILGPLEAVDGTQAIPLGGRKQRALVARLLLDANKTVAVERLVDDLWGDDVPETAVKMVQIAVSRLRKVLPADVLVTRAPGYALVVEPESIDLVRFTRLRGEARAALAAGDAAHAVDRCRAALDLFRGPPLAEFPEPFAESEAAHLEELRLTCLADRIEAELALGRHADVVPELETLVARNPLRERLRGQQMLALYLSGRQAEALEAFQRFRKGLDEELGLVPSADLQELNDRIIRQDPDLAAPPAPSARTGEQAAVDGAAPTAPAEPRATAPERRRLTIVVAELVQDAGDGADPEVEHERITGFHRAAGAVVEELGGHVAQRMGAVLVAYFGWPTAHEDGPLRAVRAALRIAREAGARAGVDTGDAVVGDESFGAVGPAASDAQRLAAQAPARGVLLGATTERLTRGWITTRVQAGGAFLAMGETAVRDQLELASARGLTPLVGREPELALLRERWSRAAAGAGQVVFVSGEPGVGKSRLVQELGRRIEGERPARLSIRCSVGLGSAPLHAVAEALGPTMPEEEDREQLLDAIVDQVCGRAEEAPMFVVAEDLHWADATTLDLFTRLVRRAPGTSLLLVATFRPEFIPERDVVGHVTQLTLARFDRMETEAMLGALLGGAPASPALAELVTARTDGVPLFIEEVVRALRDAGDLEDDSPAAHAVPETLQDSLLARLDRLGEAKEIAQTAAVLAREFPYAMLVKVIDMDEERLRAGLARLVDAGILYETRRWQEESYLFKHALIADAAYDSLLHARRRELHVRVAEAMQDERFRDIVLAAPDCVARHLTAADRPVEAIPHWRRAAAAALGASAYAEAIGHIEAGLALIDALPADRRDEVELGFQLRLGAAHMGLSGYGTPEGRAAFARAEEVSRRLEGSARLVPALYGLIAFSVGAGEQRRAHDLAQRLEGIVEAAGEEIAMEGTVLLGTSAFLRGDLAEAMERLDRAIALWDPEVHRANTRFTVQEPGVVALAMRGVTLAWRGEIAAARRSVAEGVESARAAEHPLSLCYALGAAGVLEQSAGEVERVAAIARELLAVGSEHRLPVWHGWGRAMDGWVTVRRGDVAGGVDEAIAGLEAAGIAGFVSSRAHFLAALGDACLRQGAPGEALRLADQGLPLAGSEGERTFEPDLRRVRGGALGADGTPELEQALAGAQALGARLPELRAAHALSSLRGTAEPLAAALATFPDGDGAAVVREAEAALDAMTQRA
jgi:DNA-binding SARP family transcriptional activator